MSDRTNVINKTLIWVPVAVGLFLPLIFFTVGIGVSWSAFSVQWDELIIMVFSSAILATPLLLVSYLTHRDIRSYRNASHGVVFRKWLVRFVPVLLLNAFLILDVTVAAVKRLPGSSTAGIALIYFPIIGVPTVIGLHKLADALFGVSEKLEN